MKGGDFKGFYFFTPSDDFLIITFLLASNEVCLSSGGILTNLPLKIRLSSKNMPAAIPQIFHGLSVPICKCFNVAEGIISGTLLRSGRLILGCLSD